MEIMGKIYNTFYQTKENKFDRLMQIVFNRIFNGAEDAKISIY